MDFDTCLGEIQRQLIELEGEYEFVLEDDGRWEIREIGTEALHKHGQL